MRTIETRIYKFNELDDKAKEKARDWYRDGGFDYDWWDCLYDDAENIGLTITEFDIDRHIIKGYLTESVQEVCKSIRKEHGKNTPTYKLTIKPDEDSFEHDLLEEYLSLLRKEWEYMNTDEAIDENILANEYEFTEGGKRI